MTLGNYCKIIDFAEEIDLTFNRAKALLKGHNPVALVGIDVEGEISTTSFCLPMSRLIEAEGEYTVVFGDISYTAEDPDDLLEMST